MVTGDPRHGLGLALSEASGVPFYRQVEEGIADLIRAGRLTPGTPLPSVRELAAALRVSVITTRAAYRDLEAEGLVVARQGRGTFVADGVAGASVRRAREQARVLLREAAIRARLLGLADDEQRAVLEAALATKGDGDVR